MSTATVALFLAGLLGQPLVAQESSPAPQPAVAPKVSISPEAVDFGDVFSGEDLSAWVTLTNEGETDWCVRQVKPSCGCTIATVHGPAGDEVPAQMTDGSAIACVPPGQALKVQVTFQTRNAIGNVEKTVAVHHMDRGQPSLSIPVRARVSRAIMVNPAFVQFGNITKRQPVSQEVVIEARSLGEWTIEGFESGLEGTELPEALVLEALDTEGDSRRVRVSLEGVRPVGQMFAKVRVKIGHDRVKEAEFTVIGIVQADVTFSSGHPTFPEALVFDKATAGSELTRTLKISNADPDTPYQLDSVEVLAKNPEYFTTEIRTLEEGREYEVDLTVRLEEELGSFFRGNLRLNATHPDLPAKTVAFHGWVQKSQASDSR